MATTGEHLPLAQGHPSSRGVLFSTACRGLGQERVDSYVPPGARVQAPSAGKDAPTTLQLFPVPKALWMTPQ